MLALCAARAVQSVLARLAALVGVLRAELVTFGGKSTRNIGGVV